MSYRVLIVDHSSFLRQQMISILAELNLKVVGELASAKEAVKAITQTDANIIISDVILPDSNGIELIKTFKDYLDKKFFIIVSALNTKSIIIEAIKLGAVDFLPRPLNRELFIHSILHVQQRVDRTRYD